MHFQVERVAKQPTVAPFSGVSYAENNVYAQTRVYFVYILIDKDNNFYCLYHITGVYEQ